MGYVDYCPACGKWDQELLDHTGWCVSCSMAHQPDTLFCKRCSNPFPRNKNGLYCSPCKDLNWLEQHIDEVEDLMLQGLSFSAAKKKVAAQVRPICVVCHQPIKGGKRNALFCRSSLTCITGHRRYRSLINKGMPSDIALAVLNYGPYIIKDAA